MGNKIVKELFHGPDNPRNSEGSFATLNDGRIIFVYSRYYGDSWDDEATAKLCARYSSDGGRTWTSEDEVVLENEGRRNVMSVSMLRLQDGRLALWYARKDDSDSCIPYLRTSQDGKGWSSPTRCIPAPGYFVVNNDRVIQLKSGRIIVPAAFHRNSLPADGKMDSILKSLDLRGIAIFFISDDGGKTWRESADWWALPIRSGYGLQEPGVVELADGRLYCYCRTDVGMQYEMYSEDGGDRWSAPKPSIFASPASPLSIKRIPATGELLAVWNDHSGERSAKYTDPEAVKTSWGRTPLACALSKDEGATWQHRQLLEEDPTRGFCYTAIHPLDDAVLLAYCCGGGTRSGVLQDLCIRRISLDSLRA